MIGEMFVANRDKLKIFAFFHVHTIKNPAALKRALAKMSRCWKWGQRFTNSVERGRAHDRSRIF